jgi:glycosyltransferase involved in cell wall biosynthesis
LKKSYTVVFILPRRSKVPVGGFKVVYDYANALSDLGHSVLVAHGILFKPNKSGIITSDKNPDSMRFKHRLAHYAGSWLPRGYAISIPWVKRHSNVDFRSFPILNSKNLPKASRYVATSWRTAKFLSEHTGSKAKNFYLIQGFEAWNGEPHTKLEVEATWKSGLTNIVISGWLLNLAHKLGVSATLVPNFIDREAFPQGGEIRRRPIDVLFHASNQSVKRIDKATEVVSKIRETHPNFSVHAFGTQGRPKILPDWVSYTRNPTRGSLGNLYRNSKIFLVTSDSEGWCLPALEAMSSGTLVLSTRNGGVESFAGDVARFSEDNSVAELVNSLESILKEQDAELQDISVRGVALSEQFQISKSLDGLLSVLEISKGSRESPKT